MKGVCLTCHTLLASSCLGFLISDNYMQSLFLGVITNRTSLSCNYPCAKFMKITYMQFQYFLYVWSGIQIWIIQLETKYLNPISWFTKKGRWSIYIWFDTWVQCFRSSLNWVQRLPCHALHLMLVEIISRGTYVSIEYKIIV